MRLIVALLVFGVIVMFHEFGHFILAKKNGIVVEEFAVGMGPKLVGFRKGETLYTIRILPLGGMCVMLGEDTSDTQPGSFGSKSVLARFSVIFAGPFFNFIMAFVCAVILMAMTGYISPQITEVTGGTPAEAAGLMAGDVITKYDHTGIKTFSDFQVALMLNSGETFKLTYLRDGQKQEVEITPRLDDDGIYRIGIVGGEYVEPGPLGCITAGLHEVKANVVIVIQSLKLMILGRVSRQDVAGPVGMFSMIGDSYEEATTYGIKTVFLTLINMILLLSANLGVMNLLPIPALDGGRLVFLIFEAVRGKPVDPDKEGLVHAVGFILLMILMVVIMFNDILKLMGI